MTRNESTLSTYYPSNKEHKCKYDDIMGLKYECSPSKRDNIVLKCPVLELCLFF